MFPCLTFSKISRFALSLCVRRDNWSHFVAIRGEQPNFAKKWGGVLAEASHTVLLIEYLSKTAIQLFHRLSLRLLTGSHPVPSNRCGRCCLLLLSALCNDVSVLCEAKWTHHCFPLDRMTQQRQMIAVKGEHARRHAVHILDTCSVALL